MSTELRNQINDLAMKFASQLLSALQTASLSDLANEAAQNAKRVGATGRSPSASSSSSSSSGSASSNAASALVSAPSSASSSGKRRRRSAADIGDTVEAIVKLLKTSRSGLRAEEIREKLGLARKEVPRPIAAALASRKISKKGQKRATTYFAK